MVAFRKLFYDYQRQAAKRGVPWALDAEQFRALVESPCVFCGNHRTQSRRQHKHTYTYTGVDRWDNARGYERENVVPCCGPCNQMKSVLHGDDFIRALGRIVRHQLGGGS